MEHDMMTETDLEAFARACPAGAPLRDSGPLWEALRSCALDPAGLAALVLADRQLDLPPAEGFFRWLRAHRPQVDTAGLTAADKQRIGLFWRYVFRERLCFRSQERTDAAIPELRTATLYR